MIYIIAVFVSLWFLLQRPNKGAGKVKDKQLSHGNLKIMCRADDVAIIGFLLVTCKVRTRDMQ